MKKSLLFLMIILAIVISSCAGEEKTCEETGCDAGKHCDIAKDICIQDCTADYCAVIGEACNPTTKECEPSCMLSGCESGKVCEENSNQCINSCLEVQCSTGTHCNTDTELCDDNCTAESCVGENEVCDTESNVCVVKAETFCEETSCQESSHCNMTTGHCVGGCADIECPGSMVCNPNLLRCVNPCTPGVCRGESFCNLESKLCESFVDYPEQPYGTEKGNTIENISWVNVDRKDVSLSKYHSMYKTTTYPRVIILVASAGWCSPCRQEAPLMGEFYESLLMDNGLERVAVVQTIVDDNIADGLMSSPDAFAKSWRDEYGLKFSVVADAPNSVTHKSTLDDYNPSGSIPFNLIINAKTMKIEDLQNGTDEVLGSVKTKVREIEKKVLCEELNCDEDNGHYCIFDNTNGTAECS